MIIITGTQRSGTSLMAKYLKLCGHDLGTGFWDDRIDGGLESPDICNFYRDTLGDNSFPFTKYWGMIERDTFFSLHNLEQHYQVAKFSYLLMNPDFVSLWFKVRGGKQDTFIVMDRSIESITRSKQSRAEFADEDWPGLHQHSMVLQRNKKKSLEMLDQQTNNYVMVPFPCHAGVVNTLQQARVPLPPDAQTIWNEFYDTSKIHF